MKNPVELPSFEFTKLCEKLVKECADSRLEITARIAEEHGIPFATWISTDEMTRSLATYCMMSADPAATASSIVSKFLHNLEHLLSLKHPVLPESTHPAPGVMQ